MARKPIANMKFTVLEVKTIGRYGVSLLNRTQPPNADDAKASQIKQMSLMTLLSFSWFASRLSKAPASESQSRSGGAPK